MRELCNFPNIQLQAVNNGENSPLHVAALNNNLDVVKILVKSKADVLQVNAEKLNCIELAEKLNHKEICTYLKPIVHQATIWKNKNCLAKLMVNR